MSRPKVSVIIPVFNTVRFLDQCIDSALMQRGVDVEVICIDDGSSDGSYERIVSKEQEDHRIIALKQDHHGAGAARNKGIARATGEYLHFLDSDDYLEDGILYKAVTTSLLNQAEIVIFQVHTHNVKTGRKTYADWAFRKENAPSLSFSPKEMHDKIFNSFLSWAHNKLFKKDFVDRCGLRFQEIFRTNDLYFVDTALISANRIALLEEIGINYRIGQDNNSQSTNSLHPLDFFSAFMKLKLFLVEHNLWGLYSKSFLNAALNSTIYNLESQRLNEEFVNLYGFLKKEGYESLGIKNASESAFYYEDDYKKYKLIMKLRVDDLARNGWEHFSAAAVDDWRIQKLETEKANLSKKIDALNKRIDALQKCRSYRIGRTITLIPRKLKKLLRVRSLHK